VRLVPTRANGQLAFAACGWNAETESYRPYALQVLALRGERIGDITGFVTPEFRRFGLADELPA
jgi:RNA polymerase sigma-70 factor (ECF subfamily)